MNSRYLLWDTIINIRPKINQDEFNELIDEFYQKVRLSLEDGHFERDFSSIKNDFDSDINCNCDFNEICLKKNIESLKNCKNYFSLFKQIL